MFFGIDDVSWVIGKERILDILTAGSFFIRQVVVEICGWSSSPDVLVLICVKNWALLERMGVSFFKALRSMCCGF